MRCLIGIDLGGTNIAAGAVTQDGRLLSKCSLPTGADRPAEEIVRDMARAALLSLEQAGLERDAACALGVGVPGAVDARSGMVLRTTNLDWRSLPLGEQLKKLTGLPVYLGNDADCAALGEVHAGAARAYDRAVMITLGTGVGGGIIVDGRMISGSTGAAGEIGHIHVDDTETDVCNCGNKGCLEQFASATGITRLANKKLASTDMDSVLRGGEVSAKTVFDAVKARDPLAMEVAEQFGKYLGDALAAVAGVVNPEAFVIGGGVSKAGEVLIDYIRPHYEKSVFHGSREAKFALATLGNDAGIYGAAKLVLDAVADR